MMSIVITLDQWNQLRQYVEQDHNERQAGRDSWRSRDYLAELRGDDIGENEPYRIEVEEQQ